MLFRDHFRRMSDVDMRNALTGYMNIPRPSYGGPFSVAGACNSQNIAASTILPNFSGIQYPFPGPQTPQNRAIPMEHTSTPPPQPISTVYPWVKNAIDSVNLLQDKIATDIQFKG